MIEISRCSIYPPGLVHLDNSLEHMRIFFGHLKGNSLVDLTVEMCPVLNCAKHAAYVDVIETIWLVCPLKLNIIELELDIWRGKSRLCRRDIYTNHLC
jgi:hypothetical protein